MMLNHQPSKRSQRLYFPLALCLTAAIYLFLPLTSQAQDEQDHSLVTRYEGSTIDQKRAEEFAQYTLATGVDGPNPTGETVEGRLTRIVYFNPADRSTLEIFTNYRKALEGAGLELIFRCELDACGPAFARSAWNRLNGLFATMDGDPRYLAGRLDHQGGQAYIALMVGKRRTQLDIVEVQAMEEDLVVADADALAQALDVTGKVSLYGIYFDTDKAVVKAESAPTLEQVAELLKKRPQLRLFVVGHTDMTGSFEHNRRLSTDRARAVVQTLVKDYGVSSQRLEGHGVGPLAPAATNATSSGRAKNRRVELVAR
ncbi:MAG: DUF4892 domain-containing protein [Acidobacteriota bacterium]